MYNDLYNVFFSLCIYVLIGMCVVCEYVWLGSFVNNQHSLCSFILIVRIIHVSNTFYIVVCA